MNFKTKIAAYSAAASVILGASVILSAPTTASSFNLQYKDIPIESTQAEKLWGDRLDGLETMSLEPTIFVADFMDGDTKITISLLYASNQCNMDSCPIRIFDGDKLMLEEMGCYAITEHTVASSMTAMAACDKVLLIDRNRDF